MANQKLNLNEDRMTPEIQAKIPEAPKNPDQKEAPRSLEGQSVQLSNEVSEIVEKDQSPQNTLDAADAVRKALEIADSSIVTGTMAHGRNA